jgi:hypothetical protein
MARATRALREVFGPTARFKRIDRGGLPGLQVLAQGRVLVQTFELGGDVYGRLALDSVRWCDRFGPKETQWQT